VGIEPRVAHLNKLRQRRLQQDEKKHFDATIGWGRFSDSRSVTVISVISCSDRADVQRLS
jgi:hypothetical protein